jgi:hypothetical protein
VSEWRVRRVECSVECSVERNEVHERGEKGERDGDIAEEQTLFPPNLMSIHLIVEGGKGVMLEADDDERNGQVQLMNREDTIATEMRMPETWDRE